MSPETKNAPILPALEFIDSRADAARRYQVLEPGDGYYCAAAAAYHVAPLLPAEDRRDFLHAIARDWPKRQGRHRTRVRDYRAVLAVCLSRQGLSPAQIGERFDYGREEVVTWIRNGERKLEEEARLGVEPRIEAAAEPPGLRKLGDTPDPEQGRRRLDLMRKMVLGNIPLDRPQPPPHHSLPTLTRPHIRFFFPDPPAVKRTPWWKRTPDAGGH